MIMENSKSAQLKRFQTIYKTGLRWSAILLAEIFAVWTLMQYVPRERDYLKYQKWIGVAILTAAAVYVLIAVFTDREELARIRALMRRMVSFEQIMLILLLLWYLLDCAVRSRLDGVPLFKFNDNRLFMFSMATFLFFPFAELMGSRAKRILEGMVHFAMAVYTPFNAWCIWKFYRAEFYTFPSGKRLACHRAGVSMQMGGNINITAAASVILFGLCLYMLLTQKKAVRIIYIPIAIVHIASVILTSSRTSFLALMFVSAAAAFLFMWDNLPGKEFRTRIIGALIAAALAIGVIFAIQTVLLKMFDHVYPSFVEQYFPESAETTEGSETTEGTGSTESPEAAGTSGSAAEKARQFMEEKARESIGAQTQEDAAEQSTASPADQSSADTVPQTSTSPASKTGEGQSAIVVMAEDNETTGTGARKMNDLNGRSAIWRECIKIICSSPGHFIFGVSPCYVASRLQDNSQFGPAISHAHNGLLQVGVGLGVPGMLLFLLFEIGVGLRCLKIIFKGKGIPFRYSWIVPVVILAILIIDLAEAMLFAMVRVNVPVFYILAGCSVQFCRQIDSRNAAAGNAATSN